MADPILQTVVPDGAPWRDRFGTRLPGLSPLPMESWLLRDEVFAAQMALRDDLIASRRAEVIAALPAAEAALAECLELILGALDPGYTVGAREVVRPDGVTVPLNRDDPLGVMGRLVQSDTCLMQETPDGYALTAAVLCFPASWTLAEKIGKPLPAIHVPVHDYDGHMAKRVERVFQAIRADRLLTRANLLLYESPALFAPRREEDTRPFLGDRFVRTERQTFRRLPETNAVAFGIHTTVMDMDALPEGERQAVLDALS
ncbi:MAG: DUF3445 domain-containing protein [Pseudomonadota bacterium]